jgi:hypothetical protein
MHAWDPGPGGAPRPGTATARFPQFTPPGAPSGTWRLALPLAACAAIHTRLRCWHVTLTLSCLVFCGPQVITEFCKSIGADGKVRQGLIRLAKKNGGKLGFLA